MTIERIDVPQPQLTERRQPFVDLLQRFGPQAVEATLGVNRCFDEAGLTQHAEMLRHGRLRNAELALDLPHRPLRRKQETQDRAAVGLGNDPERGFHALDIRRWAYACQGILKTPDEFRRLAEREL